MITLIPAYGRDYKSVKAVKEAWTNGNDFIIASFGHPYDGKPTSINDNHGAVMIRFKNHAKFTVIK